MEKLKGNPESKKRLKEIEYLAKVAREEFEKCKDHISQKFFPIIKNYIVESLRIESMAKEFQMLLNDEDTDKILRVHNNLMKEMERVKAVYLLPQIMRELTAVRNAFLKIRR